jgi:excisionase family DNA binding protein
MPITREMTPREAAHELGIRLDAVYSLVWAGKLPGHKADGRWRISAAAVEGRLKAQDERREQKDSSTTSTAGAR